MSIVMWDVDGVLANFQRGYHKLANEMFGTKIDPDYVPDTWDWLEETIGSEKVDRIWNRIKQDKNFWAELDPLVSRDEQAKIRELTQHHTMYFVTSRVGATAKQQTERWLSIYFGVNLNTPTVLISTRKADAANALNADYTIDDKAGNVLAVYYNSPANRKVYVYDAPYNQFNSHTMGNRVRRVHTVAKFLKDIEEGC